MLATIGDITKRPEKGATSTSLSSKKPETGRSTEGSRWKKSLLDRAVPLDIVVYAPEEMRYLFSIGSPFVEEVIETGRVLYMRPAGRRRSTK